VLFLGAGASKAVGIGDLRELTEYVNRKLIQEGYENILRNIEDVLTKANKRNRFFKPGELDMEVTFTVLNALHDPINALRDMGPFAIYVNELRKQKGFVYHELLNKPENIMKLRRSVGVLITNLCNIKDISKAKNYYAELFEFEKSIHKPDRRLFSNVVTTNYDLILERCATALSSVALPRSRGFQTDSITRENYLATDRIMENNPDINQVEYLKLHGSIDWWIRDSDKIVVERESPTSLRDETYSEQLMIYPIYEKYISQNPFFSLYYYFRRILYYHDVYVVIGYSFRDPSINNAFKDALRSKPKSRIVIVNPNPDNILQRIRPNFPRNKIDIVPIHFGSKRLYPQLKNVIDKPPGGIH
jgi:hypothetical protein